MENKTDFTLKKIVEELDSAVLSGNIVRADELAGLLYRLQGGQDEDTVMPDRFPQDITLIQKFDSGGRKVKQKGIKKFVAIAAAAALVMALGITAFATHMFGISDYVMKSNNSGSSAAGPAASSPSAASPSAPQDLIALQGYPDSKEYKASEEWNAFCSGYDTDHAILDKVGNSANEYTEKYPMYLVYSKDMADKLEEITAKYGLALHKSNTIAETQDQLFTNAGVGNFIQRKNSGGENTMLGGYIYNDGTFQYDGQAVLSGGKAIGYQFGDYVKGTFSDTYLNIGNASDYEEWLYTTKSGEQVSLALGGNKSLLIVDLPDSFVVVNILAGTGGDNIAGTGESITKEALESFADLFDFSQLK